MTGYSSLASAARALGGDVVRGAILAPGPGHSRHDRSLSVRFDPAAPGGFVVHSFCGDDPLACKDHVRAVLGIRQDTPPRLIAPRPEKPQDTSTGELAARLWRESVAPDETPVLAYLANRGVRLPAGAAGAAIRYHAACPFKGKRTPAMVALVRDILTDKPMAVHRTALTPDGRNCEVEGEKRLSLGPIGGGAVKLSPDGEVVLSLGAGEGIETALSLRHLPEFGPGPVWALLNAGNLAVLPVLAGVESLWIAEDHDPAGMRAAADTSARWTGAGKDVFRIKAIGIKADLNDIVKEGRP